MRNNIAYFDCFSGASGDMLLAALVDAGFPVEVCLRQLREIGLQDVDIAVSQPVQSSIKGCSLSVTGTDSPGKTWKAIRKWLLASELSDSMKKKALTVFTKLAEAEAKIHGVAVDDVHFHEVGAVDSIADIVGVVLGLDYLGIEQVFVSSLPMSTGWVKCQHGKLPLPAPAVCELLKNIPVYGVEYKGELVTPTGAALLAGLAVNFGAMPAMRPITIGYGTGSHERFDGKPNLLRVIIGKSLQVEETQEVEIIQTNLDDLTPEILPYVSEKLFAAGALDVSLAPLYMKKGRPGFQLTVIAEPVNAFALRNIILTETTAIGLRMRRESRVTLERQIGWVDTQYGKVRAKKITTPAGPSLRAEFEDCRRLADEKDVPLMEIYRAVEKCQVEVFSKDEERKE